MQEFPEFLSQGKHFAYGEGRPFFPEVEDSTLLGMYGSTSKPQSLKAFLKQVRPWPPGYVGYPPVVRANGSVMWPAHTHPVHLRETGSA